MKLTSKLLIVLFIISSTVSAQMSVDQKTPASKRDSVWTLSAGIQLTGDYYGFNSWPKYQVGNKPCGSVHAHGDVLWYFGSKRKIGIGFDPHIGMSQVAFEAIIPNTDFANPADSFTVDSKNDLHFYRDKSELTAQLYTYRINYLNLGANLHVNFRLNEMVDLSIYTGILQYIIAGKNFENMSLAYRHVTLHGTTIEHVDLLEYESNFYRACAGLKVNVRLTKKIALNVNGQSFLGRDFDKSPFIGFLLDKSEGPKGYSVMNRCFSVGIGLNYCFIN